MSHTLRALRADRGAVYLLAFYAYFALGLLLQVFPPLLNHVMSEFGVNRQSAALVMTLFMTPFAFLAIPSGLLVDRYGIGGMGRLAFVLMLLGGTATTVAGSFPVLLAGRIVSGAGAAVLMTVLLKLIIRSVPREQYGLALGVFAAGLPFGTGIAFNLLAPLGEVLGWRVAVLGAALVVGSAGIVFERLALRQVAIARDAAVNPSLAFHSGELWRLAATTVFGYMAILGFTTWTPTTLVKYAGIPPWVAALIASLLLVIDIPLSPLWGAVSDRVGRRKPFIVGGFAMYLAGSLAVPSVAVMPGPVVPGLVAIITFMAVGCAMFFPTALAIAGETAAPELAGGAYGLFNTAQVVGMMLGPGLIGYVLDHGSVPQAFLGMSIMALAGLLAALTLRSR